LNLWEFKSRSEIYFSFLEKNLTFAERKNHLGLKLDIPPPLVSPSSFRKRIPLRRQRRETGAQESVFDAANKSARETLRTHIAESNARYIAQRDAARRNAFCFTPPSPPLPSPPPTPFPTPNKTFFL
jgi:hypothetical protein